MIKAFWSLLFIVCVYCCSGQTDSLKMYMFGHSLVNYESPNIDTDEGKLAHWIYLLAAHDQQYFASTGQWGFLPSHAMLPPTAAWGYSQVPPAWDSYNEAFDEADFNSILLTPGNFVQWQPSNEPYPSDPQFSPLTATETIFDWVADQEDEMKFYVYENWPDLAPYLNNGFPASNDELDAYHQYTATDFHDWWIEYQDWLRESRPEYKVRFIPAGSIISGILTDVIPGGIPAEALYEDDAPHGTANSYFLGGLVCYMAMYQRPASLEFDLPQSIHPLIRDNFSSIVDFIWSELNQFNYDDGESRVFFDNVSSSDAFIDLEDNPDLTISPNPNVGVFTLHSTSSIKYFEILDSFGRIIQTGEGSDVNTQQVNLSDLSNGLYYVRINKTSSSRFSLFR